MPMGKRARSKKRGLLSVTSRRAQAQNGTLKPLRTLDTALIEENEWLKCQQEKFRW